MWGPWHPLPLEHVNFDKILLNLLKVCLTQYDTSIIFQTPMDMWSSMLWRSQMKQVLAAPCVERNAETCTWWGNILRLCMICHLDIFVLSVTKKLKAIEDSKSMWKKIIDIDLWIFVFCVLTSIRGSFPKSCTLPYTLSLLWGRLRLAFISPLPPFVFAPLLVFIPPFRNLRCLKSDLDTKKQCWPKTQINLQDV